MKIKVKEIGGIESELLALGATKSQAWVIEAVMRGVAGDILNERNDEIKFACHGVKYKLTLSKEN